MAQLINLNKPIAALIENSGLGRNVYKLFADEWINWFGGFCISNNKKELLSDLQCKVQTNIKKVNKNFTSFNSMFDYDRIYYFYEMTHGVTKNSLRFFIAPDDDMVVISLNESIANSKTKATIAANKRNSKIEHMVILLSIQALTYPVIINRLLSYLECGEMTDNFVVH